MLSEKLCVAPRKPHGIDTVVAELNAGGRGDEDAVGTMA
jgi:hypothetical protein